MSPFRKLTAGVVLALAIASPAGAAGGQASFALTPVRYDPTLPASKSYFVAVAGPGTTIRNSVRVKNTGSRTGTAYLYAVDATTGRTSGAVYLDRARPRRGVGSWVVLGATSVTLAPGRTRVVPFTVRVPATAGAGDHLGGIVAENAALTSGGARGALRIRIRHLTISAVEVQVPGTAGVRVNVAGASASGEHGYQYVNLAIRNAGALTSKPFGRLLVTDSAGRRVAARKLRLDVLLPGTAIDYPVLLPGKALAPGRYRATVALTYGASALGYRRAAGRQRTIHRSFSFTISGNEYRTLYRGVAPVKAPAAAKAARPPAIGTSTIWALTALAALVVVLAFLVLGLRRWARVS